MFKKKNKYITHSEVDKKLSHRDDKLMNLQKTMTRGMAQQINQQKIISEVFDVILAELNLELYKVLPDTQAYRCFELNIKNVGSQEIPYTTHSALQQMGSSKRTFRVGNEDYAIVTKTKK